MKVTGLFLALVVVCVSSTAAQTGAPGNGAAFGTRNTRTCSVTPASPTSAQLQQAFICEEEIYTPPGSSQSSLALVSNVAMQFSKARPYNSRTDAYSGIDVTQPVFDARGNYVAWTCFVPSHATSGNVPVAGKNCWKYIGTGVHGIAFRDTFGAWHVKVCCTVSADGSNIVYYPPPTNLF